MFSVLIAENTLMNIMRKYALENSNLNELVFNSKKNFLGARSRLNKIFLNNTDMNIYYNTFFELNDIYEELSQLATCKQ